MIYKRKILEKSRYKENKLYILLGFIPFSFIMPTWLGWFYALLLTFFLYRDIIQNRKINNINQPIYSLIKIYIIYISIINICGILIAENYWEYRALINNLFKYYCIGIVIWASSITYIYRIYKKTFFIIILSTLACSLISKSFSFIYASIFSFTPYLLLYKIRLSKIRSFIMASILIFSVLTYYNIQRIDIIKILFIIIFFIILKRITLSNINKFKPVILIFIIAPFILLLTSIVGIFNPFKMDEYIKGEYATSRIENGEVIEENFKADTRTSIYIDIFNSLNKHHSWTFGRTPAQGYECLYVYTSNIKKLGVTERNSSEVGLLNILLHYGIIGFILYSYIIFYGIWLAFQRSNNDYCKLLGFYMSFFYCISWIWQPPQLSLFYVFDMIILGLCYSPSFRKLTNRDIRVFSIKYSL